MPLSCFWLITFETVCWRKFIRISMTEGGWWYEFNSRTLNSLEPAWLIKCLGQCAARSALSSSERGRSKSHARTLETNHKHCWLNCESCNWTCPRSVALPRAVSTRSSSRFIWYMRKRIAHPRSSHKSCLLQRSSHQMWASSIGLRHNLINKNVHLQCAHEMSVFGDELLEKKE